MNAERVWTVAKDAILFFGGMAGLGHQTLVAEKPDTWLLLVFAGMAGVPGLTSLWSLRQGGTPTDGQSSPSQPAGQQRSSGQPSPPPPGGEP